jgi:hypothetical protein
MSEVQHREAAMTSTAEILAFYSQPAAMTALPDGLAETLPQDVPGSAMR